MEETKTETIRVKGMFCPNCEKRVSNALQNISGVLKADVSFTDEKVTVTYSVDKTEMKTIKEKIESLGYETVTDNAGYIQIISIMAIIAVVYFVASRSGWTGIFNRFPSAETASGLGMLFVIGLFTSVHCTAMCGGINLAQSVIAVKNGGRLFGSNLAYNAGRVISYTVIGGIAGGIGGVVSFHDSLRGAVIVFAGSVMLAMSFTMLGVFRPLKKFSLRLPAGLYMKFSQSLRKKSSFATGILNGLMPCGPLQSVQIYALSTGSVVMGAAAMFLFGLGTVPLMFGFGLFSGKLNRKYAGNMLIISALLIFVMGIHMASNGLALMGVSIFADKNGNAAVSTEGFSENVQRVVTEIDYGSYKPITVRKGIPVEWTIIVPEGKLNGCNGEIEIPAYKIKMKLSTGKNIVRFTPQQTGVIPYSCWMGMIKSSIIVVD